MISYSPFLHPNTNAIVLHLVRDNTMALRRQLARGCLRHAAALVLLPVGSKRLGELAAVSDLRAIPVEDVDRNDDDAGQGTENGGRIVDGRIRRMADVVVEGRGVHGGDTGEEVTGPSIATGGGGGVDTVGRYHVVD